MRRPKVKIALGRHIRNIRRHVARLAQLPHRRRRDGVIDRAQHQRRQRRRRAVGFVIRYVGGFEGAVNVHNLVLRDAVAHFGVETAGWADAGDDGVSVEAVEDAAGCDLGVRH